MFLSDLLNSLRKTYGNKITTGDLRGYAAAHGVSYRSITKKITKYKTGRGKWNLTVSPVSYTHLTLPTRLSV